MGGIAFDANPPGRDCSPGYDSGASFVVMGPLVAARTRDGTYFLGVGEMAGLAG